MRARGFTVFAIDHQHNKHKPQASLTELDIGSPHAQSVILEMIRELRPVGLHLGCPCGTCSRARERALPSHLHDFSAPPPLRDAGHVLGLPDLRPQDKAKVVAANSLYRFTIEILRLCMELSIVVSIENPGRSWLWAVLAHYMRDQPEPFRQWYSRLDPVEFDNCVHGGSRKKHTRLLSTPSVYNSMAGRCDGSHSHEPWLIHKDGQRLHFDTAAEGAYPKLLCVRMAECLAEYVGLPPVPEAKLSSSALTRAAFGTQTFTFQPLVSEFATFVYHDKPQSSSNMRLLASHLTGDQQPTPLDDYPSEQVQRPTKSLKQSLKYGVQWEPYDFLQQAKQAKRPLNPSIAIPNDSKKALVKNLTTDPVELAKSRLKAVHMINQLHKELKADEHAMKQQWDTSVAKVLSSKNILLWESLLKAAGFADMDVVSFMKEGVKLTGSHSQSPLFPKDWKPAIESEDNLIKSAKWRRRAMQTQTETDQSKQDDLHRATLEEVGLGFLEGPFTEQQLDQKFNGEWLLNKRFLLYQGSPEEPKHRVIDDCRRSGLNDAYTTNFKLQLYDMDTLACILAAVAQAVEKGQVEFEVADEGTIGGSVHKAVRGQRWMGRTLDLSKAYKQVPLRPDSKPFCVIGYWKDGWKYYTTGVLPFGAVSAVYSFNRISRSLHFILSTYLAAVCTCYYDDFPTNSTEPSAAILTKSMTAVLNLLGWDHAQVGKKAVDFASDFAALGVHVCLDELHESSFVLENKESRIKKLCEMLDEISQRGSISRGEAAEIQGHLNFASAFFVTKALRFLLGSFDRLSNSPGEVQSKKLRTLCKTASNLLRSMPPRRFEAKGMEATHLLFSDGAWEQSRASAGFVFVNGKTGEGIVTQEHVPDRLVKLWTKEVGSQLICQIELFAFLAARVFIADQIRNQKLIAWIDNEAARATLVKGSSSSNTMKAMARVIQAVDLVNPSLIWFERVASHSNPADLPSRGQPERAARELGLNCIDEVHVSEVLVRAIEAATLNPEDEVML